MILFEIQHDSGATTTLKQEDDFFYCEYLESPLDMRKIRTKVESSGDLTKIKKYWRKRHLFNLVGLLRAKKRFNQKVIDTYYDIYMKESVFYQVVKELEKESQKNISQRFRALRSLGISSTKAHLKN